MNAYIKPGYPTHTPWGAPDQFEEVAPGIAFYSTPGHGGYYVTPALLAKMPAALRGFKPWAGPGWYEEDCDWAIVYLAFADTFIGDDPERIKRIKRAAIEQATRAAEQPGTYPGADAYAATWAPVAAYARQLGLPL